MFKIISAFLITIAVTASGFALSMDEAVNSALEKNLEFLAQQHKADASRYSVDTAKTPYMPQVDAEYSYANSSEKAYGPKDEISTFSLSVGYNLFNGFSDKYSLGAAKSAYAAEKHNTEAVKQDIILSVKKAYINVLDALQNIAVAENAVQLLENQLKDIQLSYDVGYVAKNEVLKVEAELASSVQSVLSARSGYRLAVFNLEKITGLDIAETEEFENLSEDVYFAGNMNELKEKMFENRSELKYLEELIKAKQYKIKSVKGGYMPKVKVGATYYSYGEDLNPSDRTYTYDSETVLGATVSMNIFDGMYKYNNTKSMESERLYMMYSLRNTKADMTLQLKNALENYDLSVASLAAADKELDSAKENYRITQSQFKQKVATNTDLMDARMMLTRAEKTYNTARFNIQRALADISRIVQE